MPNRAGQRATRRPRRATITEEEIVSTALGLADREGLDAVSIRRVATALDVRPMSLYTYIETKEELFQLMANQVVGEVLVDGALPDSWREALTLIARRSHVTFTTHPWLLEISQHRRNLGHNALRHAEQLLEAVAPLDLDAADAWQIAFSVNDYTLGHALRIAHTRPGDPKNYPPFDPQRYPRVATALRAVPDRDEATFETGLSLLLDGIETRYGSRHERSSRRASSARRGRSRP